MKKILFILLLPILCATKCEKELPPPDTKITIINESDKHLVLYKGFIPSVKDTMLIGGNRPGQFDDDRYAILRGEKKEFPDDAKAYFIDNPSSFLRIQLFDRDEVRANSWDYIRNNQKVLRTYVFNKDSCEKLNYDIVVKYR